MLLSQLPMTMMLQMLTQNPGVGLFSFSTSDFPTGVPRIALLSAFVTAATVAGCFDANGNWNTQCYLPGSVEAETKLLTAPSLSQVQAALPNGASGSPVTFAGSVGAGGSTIVGGQNPGISVGSTQLAADNDMINNPSAVS